MDKPLQYKRLPDELWEARVNLVRFLRSIVHDMEIKPNSKGEPFFSAYRKSNPEKIVHLEFSFLEKEPALYIDYGIEEHSYDMNNEVTAEIVSEDLRHFFQK